MQAYDPLDYENLAKSVVQALLSGPEVPLPPPETFEGCGVYAIYYHGDFKGISSIPAVHGQSILGPRSPSSKCSNALRTSSRSGLDCFQKSPRTIARYSGALSSTAVSYSSVRFFVMPARTDELTMLDPVRLLRTRCMPSILKPFSSPICARNLSVST